MKAFGMLFCLIGCLCLLLEGIQADVGVQSNEGELRTVTGSVRDQGIEILLKTNDLKADTLKQNIIAQNDGKCEKGSVGMKWAGAMAASVVISLIAFIGIVVIPIDRPMGRQFMDEWVIPFLVAFGVGSLLGDAILHLLPDAWGLHEHPESTNPVTGPDQGRKALWVGLAVLGGIFLFFILERLITHIQGHVPRHHNDHEEPHYYHSGRRFSHVLALDEQVALVVPKKSTKKQPSGYLILFADGVHNLTDGFALGAAFTASFSIGIATSLAVLLHEVPQELGDFGILVSAGFSKKAALLWNFVSSLTCVIGAVVGILVASATEWANEYILAAVAGGFIYVALVGMMHHLLYVSNVWQTFLQSFSILLGFAAMFCVAFWLEDFNFCLRLS